VEFEALRYKAQDGVATVTLHRPDALNAITPTMLDELRAALEQARADDAVGVIVLTGEGRAFSAGVDLKALGDRELVDGCVGDILDLPARAVIETITEADEVVVASVNGHCFTGALELALSCDLMVVAEEAKLGDTHAKFGLRPTWGMSARLPAAVGITRARELSLTARTFTGVEAAAWGMAIRAVPRAKLDEAVAELCKGLLANSRGSLAAYKALYREPEVLAAVEREATRRFALGDATERLAGFRK